MARASQPLKANVAVPRYKLAPGADKIPDLAISKEWADYLFDMDEALDRTSDRQVAARATAQAASIAVTPLSVLDQVEGVWRITWQVRVSQVATTSSSIQVTISWTQGGVAQSFSGAALIGNLLTTREGVTLIIRSDDAQPISYATAYASVGATPMQYELDVIAELVSASA